MSPHPQPHAVARVRTAYARIKATARPEIWIDLRPQQEVEAEARAMDARLAAGATAGGGASEDRGEHLPSQGNSSP